MSEQAAPARPAELLTITVPVARLRPNPWNPNRQNEVVARAERESIRRFGFIDPITAMRDPDGTDCLVIIDGEHRWGAAKDEGYTDVPVIVLDVTVEEAKKLTIVLNETRGDADVVLLGQLLSEIRDSNPDEFMVALPYSQAELDHLLSIGATDWDDFGSGSRERGDPSVSADHELVLAFDSADELARFREYLEQLRGKYGAEDAPATDLVVEAVRREALA